MPKVRIFFEPRDLWVGVYWTKRAAYGHNQAETDVYICLLPMLPIRVRFEHKTDPR